MNSNLMWGLLIGGPVLAFVIGLILSETFLRKKLKNRESKILKEVTDAEVKSREILIGAKDEAIKIKEQAKADEEDRRKSVENLENNLRRREQLLDERSSEIDKTRTKWEQKIAEADEFKNTLRDAKKEQDRALVQISKISREEAKDILLKKVEKDIEGEIVEKLKQKEKTVTEEGEKTARNILSIVIERLASEHTAETTVSTVNIQNDEMKGRIIGREGRNIQAFEKAAGVDVIIDDTPEVVVISCFDPVRRQIAKIALESLVKDGRIHPTKIEEALEKATKQINEEVKEAGEQAIYELGVTGVDPDLIKILGRLKFRTSYGQNVLRHSIEVAHLAGMLASEIGANATVAKKGGLFHDIGKSIDQEMGGSHIEVGVDIAKKFKLSEGIVDAIESHHEGTEPKTIEALLVKSADAISSARPGARLESLENYIRRLKDLENVTNSFPGVEKSYAIQAGREVRIIVKPEEITDQDAVKLSHDIARKIEKELQYPGNIKVNVIRETRAIDFAK